MATLTKIFTGMTGGPEAIQGNFDTLNGAMGQVVTLTAQTNTGLTWVNGFKDQDNGRFKYQVLTINGQKFLLISGQIAFTQTIKAWNTVQMVKFPSGVGIDNAHMLAGSVGMARNGKDMLQFSVSADGLSAMAFDHDLALPASGSWIPDIAIIATI